ncbi:MAG TPA: response regulator [Cellvibrio sp.]|nr:response regulator [Cellvibrio sp.]
MKKILVVEDSEMVMKIMRHLLLQYPQYHPLFAGSMAQVQEHLAEHSDIFAALVDLNLPDAPNGEVVDLVLSKKIPSIVLTGTYDEKHREQLFSKGIVDYVTKEGRYAYTKAVNLLARLEKNQQIKVLVVDDSDMSRKHVCNLLKRHLFQILEADDGVEAIKVLLENPDIKLLITDYNMPRMDGFDLVRNLRYKYDKIDLIMIGVSGESSEALSAKFIKNGANDFLRKPFLPEEFYCRVAHNIEYLELVEKITDSTRRDHLTHLYHRHYFFNAARDIFLQAREKSLPLALAVVNVDRFREINDSYGHEWGDAALKHIAGNLNNMLSRFLVCRADGDDFFVLLSGMDNEKAVEFMSRVRQLLSEDVCTINGQPHGFYFSVGVSNQINNGIDEQLRQAGKLLRLAKESGGNMVLGDSDAED